MYSVYMSTILHTNNTTNFPISHAHVKNKSIVSNKADNRVLADRLTSLIRVYWVIWVDMG